MQLAVLPPDPRVWIGFYGPAGSGKTHTAVDLAMSICRAFDIPQDRPIAMFDPEKSAKWHTARVQQYSGRPLLSPPLREDGGAACSLPELREFLGACVKIDAAVVLIDGMTDILKDTREAYFAKRDIDEPTPDQYGRADAPFTKVMKKLRDSHMNVICTAREQQVYGTYINAKGKKVSGPVGVKFGAKDSAYDFDLVAHMQQLPEKGRDDRRVMTIDKDRSDTIHGQSFDFPYKVSEVFGGYLAALKGERVAA